MRTVYDPVIDYQDGRRAVAAGGVVSSQAARHT